MTGGPAAACNIRGMTSSFNLIRACVKHRQTLMPDLGIADTDISRARIA